MIRFSAFLVVVAVGLLIAGVVTSRLLLVYLAIGVSGVALLALGIGTAVRWRELFGKPKTAASEASPQGPAPAPTPQSEPELQGYPHPAAQPAVAAPIGAAAPAGAGAPAGAAWQPAAAQALAAATAAGRNRPADAVDGSATATAAWGSSLARRPGTRPDARYSRGRTSDRRVAGSAPRRHAAPRRHPAPRRHAAPPGRVHAASRDPGAGGLGVA